MERSSKQSCVEHQKRSLIEFLLGGHGVPGWLDAYSNRSCRPTSDRLTEPSLKNHAAAA